MNLICRWRDHDWFPNLVRSEFLPLQDICLRCGARRTQLPWGQCLGGHPMAEHYQHDPMVAEPIGACAGPS